MLQHFEILATLQLHKYKAHGIKSIFRRYVDTDYCFVCLNKFWERERVVNHLRYRAQTCRNMCLIQDPYVSQERADELDSEAFDLHAQLYRSRHRRHKAKKPAGQLIGHWSQLLAFGPVGIIPQVMGIDILDRGTGGFALCLWSFTYCCVSVARAPSQGLHYAVAFVLLRSPHFPLQVAMGRFLFLRCKCSFARFGGCCYLALASAPLFVVFRSAPDLGFAGR